jgi:LPXTG-site transpeptidase (sortase) family protein
MQTITSKDKPQGTHEFLGHLGISTEENHIPKNIDEALAETAQMDTSAIPSKSASDAPSADAKKDMQASDASKNVQKTTVVSTSIKKFIPYFAVFGIGIIAFVILFTNVSFSNLKNIKSQPVVQQASAQTVPTSQQAAYNTWINSYFFDVSNPAILDPNYDYSGNGLTNYQKFLLGLNPTKQDTAGIGMTDSEALIAGIDPLTGKPMDDAQKSAVAANIDLEGLSNRLALNTLDNTPQVLGASTVNTSTIASAATQSTSNSSDETAATTAAGQVTDNGTAVNQSDIPPINTSITAELNIPDLKITVPIIWGDQPSDVETDLQNGVVHYPGTALPGQIGTAYISGHSSNYVWAKGSYNNIFATLGKLKKNASFTITATSTSGKKLVFHYVVTSSGIFSPTDQKQFASIGKSTVGLSTCWPVGTSSNRLVVYGQLTQVEQGN